MACTRPVPQARENQLEKDIAAAFDAILRDLLRFDQRAGRLFFEEVTDELVAGESERKYSDVVTRPMALSTIMCASPCAAAWFPATLRNGFFLGGNWKTALQGFSREGQLGQ